MRGLGLGLLCSCLTLSACGSPKATEQQGSDAKASAEPQAEPAKRAPAPASEAELPPTDEELVARAMAEIEAGQTGTEESGSEDTGGDETGEGGETAGETGEAAQAGSEGELTPELPKGPEPGSPEADAELAALLDESTITQDEFDAAFKAGGPKLDGDAFVFGPGGRTRGKPTVAVGAVSVDAGKVDAEAVAAVAKADRGQLEACLGMGLRKDDSQLGGARLRLSVGADGAVSKASVEQAPTLLDPLKACLGSVAKTWTIAGASAGEVTVPLTLSVAER